LQQPLSLSDSLRHLRDKRFLPILLLGFCQGFPFVLTGSILTLWLQDSGFSRSAIGFIGAITVVYAFNWTWAPFVDRLQIPVLYRRFGQRRSWILLCQALIAFLLLAISFADPNENLLFVTIIAVAIAACGATQDISVDAYRITIFSKEEMDTKMPYAAAMTTIGWWAGYGFIGGALALALGGETIGLAWPIVYRCMILIYLVIIVLVILCPEPTVEDGDVIAGADESDVSLKIWFSKYFLGPFKEFFGRCGFQLAFSVLLLLVVFRLGEAVLGRMSLVFYIEVGFTTDEISFYQKFVGGLLVVVYSLLAAVINTRFGVIRGLFIAGVAMAGANLLFALIAIVGPNTNLLLLTLVVDNFFQAFAAVAFVSFISYFTSRTYTGTQYALMSSLSTLGRTTLAAGSGLLVDFLNGNWVVFFVITTLMVIPGLCILLWVGKLMKTYDNAPSVQGSS